MADGKKSKTNVTARNTASIDRRPKAELVVESYRKPNGAIGTARYWQPINQEGA